MPEISVLLTVNNREKYLAESIESILAQTFRDFEFIIVNDGSTDRSGEIIQKYASQDTRIKYLESKENQGIPFAVSVGLKHCSGKYIARMDSDDISLPDRLKIQYEFLESHPRIDALGTGFDFIDETGNKTGKFVVRPSGSMITRFRMLYYCILHNPTMMMKSSFYQEFNKDHAEEAFTIGEDYHFWVRKNFDSVYDNLPDRLLLYRLHDRQITSVGLMSLRDNFAISAKSGFEKLLGRSIPLDVVRTFYLVTRYSTKEPSSVNEAVHVIYEAQRAFEKQNKLSADERYETRKFSYEKLKSVIMKYREFPFVFISGSCFLIRLLPKQFAFDLVHKFYKKTEVEKRF